MIDCAVPYNSWNIFWCYILLFIDIKQIVTDYLYLKNVLLGPTCAMIIVFLLVNMITSQETSTKFLCRTLMSTTANRKLPYTSRTLANGQSVREDYGRFEECTVRLREILRFV